MRSTLDVNSSTVGRALHLKSEPLLFFKPYGICYAFPQT